MSTSWYHPAWVKTKACLPYSLAIPHAIPLRNSPKHMLVWNATCQAQCLQPSPTLRRPLRPDPCHGNHPEQYGMLPVTQTPGASALPVAQTDSQTTIMFCEWPGRAGAQPAGDRLKPGMLGTSVLGLAGS